MIESLLDPTSSETAANQLARHDRQRAAEVERAKQEERREREERASSVRRDPMWTGPAYCGLTVPCRSCGHAVVLYAASVPERNALRLCAFWDGSRGFVLTFSCPACNHRSAVALGEVISSSAADWPGLPGIGLADHPVPTLHKVKP